MTLAVKAKSLTAIIAGQQWDALQTAARSPDDWNNRYTRVRGASDVSSVVNGESGTKLAAGHNTQVLRV
jgi:hypothetical protein